MQNKCTFLNRKENIENANNLHALGKKTMPGRLILVKHLNAETQNITLKRRHYTPISILCCFLCHVWIFPSLPWVFSKLWIFLGVRPNVIVVKLSWHWNWVLGSVHPASCWSCCQQLRDELWFLKTFFHLRFPPKWPSKKILTLHSGGVSLCVLTVVFVLAGAAGWMCGSWCLRSAGMRLSSLTALVY